MITKNSPSYKVHAKFLKTVLAKCVDVGWDDDTLCRMAGVSRRDWRKIRRFEESPGLRDVIRVCSALGLEAHYSIQRDTDWVVKG